MYVYVLDGKSMYGTYTSQVKDVKMTVNPWKKFFFFISHTQYKAKRTMRENQYETNSKENPVWNKWQPQFLIMCSHVDSNIFKKIYASVVHGDTSRNILLQFSSNYFNSRFTRNILTHSLNLKKILISVWWFNLIY